MRTLYDIVRSCLFTIAACVYQAIHQNMPDPKAKMWGRLQVRIKITIYALIAPEMMIWWAMRQWYGAIEIAKEKIVQPQVGLNWTQTHGQFAQMGGFARKDDKCVIYPEELIGLLRNGCIDLDQLKLTKEDIDDKSKGDILSKAFVAFQTTWFVFECLARLQQKLPLIELEVVTLAFAVLNVITYALWWYKPLNALRPIYLHIRETPGNWSRGQIDYVEDDGWWESTWKQCIKRPFVAVVVQAQSQAEEKGDGMVAKGRAAVGKMVNAIKEDVGKRGWWLTVWKRLMKQPFLAVVMPLFELLWDSDVHSEAMHVSTFYGVDIGEEKLNLVQRLSCFVGIIFGVIHFLAWHSTFPTHTELLLWRISSIVLVVQPVFLVLVFLITDECLGPFLLFVFLAVGPISYILARFCLLALALLTLQNLPPHALDSITWTFFIPHL
ncbi:hypothetical protein BDN72DRAFT_934304 [Pluteus cervinus]|uniref:Uncharacterized protein n=1 Tax=Pluteus cervinus TaxID=181527 RepID=A0ACD3A7F4_9AGAR|nr:hypothetical protein BDN72DRAFT_934304 [Pluteus cervinus]